jgi:ABC-type sulfate/molybdate transport systems ATPase subunit
LSAGQRRRLAIAIAIARAPRLLLLDEPHAGLDSEGRSILDEVLLGLTGGTCTVLLASHELELARSLSTREVALESGRLAPSIPVQIPREPAPA